jgi:DNA-binding Lrp family transcriptional regulator
LQVNGANMKPSLALDDLDRRLLGALGINARATNRALAGLLGLSPSASLARLRRLEHRRVIVGYTVLLGNTIVAGRQSYFVDVELDAPRAAQRQFEALLRADADVLSAARVAGKCDYLVRMAGAPAASWEHFANAAQVIGVPIRQARITAIVEGIKGQIGV